MTKKKETGEMNRRFDFKWEFEDFEIRTVHEDWRDSDTPINKDRPIQLVRYFTDEHNSCYTVAYWCIDEDGYSLKFVGNRPFKDIDTEDMTSIWPQLCAAQEMLDSYFKACEAGRY